MKIKDIINVLENFAPPPLQEAYDNAGMITGDKEAECTGILCCLDVTEAVVEEAVQNNCNMVVAHHPVVFRGLKSITGRSYVERTIINAIKHDIALYAIHTNLDNILAGVNGKMASLLGLVDCRVLLPKKDSLKKLFTYVPGDHADRVREAVWAVGAGNIGNYSECSFNTGGKGTFRAGAETDPFVGRRGELHTEDEIKVEIVFPFWLEAQVVSALTDAHPYEEPAYDIVTLDNTFSRVGSGLTGILPYPVDEKMFLAQLKSVFKLSVIRHTALTGKLIKTVSLCGGAGSFLIPNALRAGSDIYITADMKYHEFFDAEGKMIVADIGHYESEQFTIDLIYDILREKFPTFAVLKTAVNTNPVFYYA